MSFEVDFITLGDASEQINVPSPTLRHWTQQLEDYNVHYVKRNNRNERIYYQEDIEIFEYLRDLKIEYGRRTTTKDLSYMVKEKGDKGEFKLRSREDAPSPKPSNKTADLLSQEDIKQLMSSERVKQFMEIVVSETTKELRDTLVVEMKEELDAHRIKAEEDAKRIEESLKRRDEQMIEMFQMWDKKREEEANRGFLKKLFGHKKSR